MAANEESEAYRSNVADARDIRADARDVTAGNRDSRADRREMTADKASADDIVRHQKALKILVCILLILTVASMIRSFIIQDTVNELRETTSISRTATQETLESTREARRELQEAIKTPSPRSQEAIENIVTALEAIVRIEHQLCGGPCPPPPNE